MYIILSYVTAIYREFIALWLSQVANNNHDIDLILPDSCWRITKRFNKPFPIFEVAVIVNYYRVFHNEDELFDFYATWLILCIGYEDHIHD